MVARGDSHCPNDIVGPREGTRSRMPWHPNHKMLLTPGPFRATWHLHRCADADLHRLTPNRGARHGFKTCRAPFVISDSRRRPTVGDDGLAWHAERRGSAASRERRRAESRSPDNKRRRQVLRRGVLASCPEEHSRHLPDRSTRRLSDPHGAGSEDPLPCRTDSRPDSIAMQRQNRLPGKFLVDKFCG